MNISIIVLTHNSEKYLEKCLNAILENMDTNDEFLIIDNDSTDSTRELLKKYTKKADIYLCNKNVGISEGRNLGIKLAKNRVLAFIDSDLIVDTNSLKIAKKDYQDWQVKALTGQYLEYGEGLNWFMEMRRELFAGKKQKNFNKYIKLNNFTTLAGGFCLIDKEVIEKYGGYDLSFYGAPSEDVNLELMMIRDNIPIAFDKNFTGKHYKEKMKWKNLTKRFKNSGISLTRLIKSSIDNHFKIPFNSVWPYLPIVVPLEILFIFLSIFHIYFLIPSFLMMIVRITKVLLRRKRNRKDTIKFILIRPYTDIVTFIYMMKEIFVSSLNIEEIKNYQYEKM